MTANKATAVDASLPDVAATHVSAQFKHNSPIIACRFSPDGKAVFFGAEDHKVWRWEIGAENAVAFAGHNSWVRAIGCSADGQTLITGGYDGQLIWWSANAQKPEPLREVAAHHGWIRALAISPDGEFVATAGNDKMARIWRLDNGSLVQELRGHESHVYNAAFHPQGTAFVTGDLKANLIEWDLATGKQMRQMTVKTFSQYDKVFRAIIGGFRGLQFSADGNRLAGCGMINVSNAFAGVGNPAVVEIDWESGKQVIEHHSKAKLKGVAWGVALHPAELTIAVNGGGAGGYLLFWRPDEEEEQHSFKLPNTGRDLDLSSDGLHLVTAHFDRHVRISRMAAKNV